MRQSDIAVVRRIEHLTGASQGELALQAGVSRITWSRWACHGGARVQEVHRVIVVFGLDVDDVFGVLAGE